MKYYKIKSVRLEEETWERWQKLKSKKLKTMNDILKLLLDRHDEWVAEEEIVIQNARGKPKIVGQNEDEINKIFSIFYKTINKNINFANKTQREAVEEMIRLHGFERVQKVAEFACKIHGQKYAPVITTPLQLKDKWSALEAWAKTKGEEKQSNKIQFVG